MHQHRDFIVAAAPVKIEIHKIQTASIAPLEIAIAVVAATILARKATPLARRVLLSLLLAQLAVLRRQQVES